MSAAAASLHSFIIKPNGWTMNGSDKCHGISQERAMKEGIGINVVLKEYNMILIIDV